MKKKTTKKHVLQGYQKPLFPVKIAEDDNVPIHLKMNHAKHKEILAHTDFDYHVDPQNQASAFILCQSIACEHESQKL